MFLFLLPLVTLCDASAASSSVAWLVKVSPSSSLFSFLLFNGALSFFHLFSLNNNTLRDNKNQERSALLLRVFNLSPISFFRVSLCFQLGIAVREFKLFSFTLWWPFSVLPNSRLRVKNFDEFMFCTPTV